MKNILLFSFLTLSFFISGCASTSAAKKSVDQRLTKEELDCQRSCGTVAMCSARAGRPYGEHEMLTCKMECIATNPVIRSIIIKCSDRTLAGDCDVNAMQTCVRNKLMKVR